MIALICKEFLQIIKKKTTKKYAWFLNTMKDTQPIHKMIMQVNMIVYSLMVSARMKMFSREIDTEQGVV